MAKTNLYEERKQNTQRLIGAIDYYLQNKNNLTPEATQQTEQYILKQLPNTLPTADLQKKLINTGLAEIAYVTTRNPENFWNALPLDQREALIKNYASTETLTEKGIPKGKLAYIKQENWNKIQNLPDIQTRQYHIHRIDKNQLDFQNGLLNTTRLLLGTKPKNQTTKKDTLYEVTITTDQELTGLNTRKPIRLPPIEELNKQGYGTVFNAKIAKINPSYEREATQLEYQQAIKKIPGLGKILTENNYYNPANIYAREQLIKGLTGRLPEELIETLRKESGGDRNKLNNLIRHEVAKQNQLKSAQPVLPVLKIAQQTQPLNPETYNNQPDQYQAILNKQAKLAIKTNQYYQQVEKDWIQQLTQKQTQKTKIQPTPELTKDQILTYIKQRTDKTPILTKDAVKQYNKEGWLNEKAQPTDAYAQITNYINRAQTGEVKPTDPIIQQLVTQHYLKGYGKDKLKIAKTLDQLEAGTLTTTDPRYQQLINLGYITQQGQPIESKIKQLNQAQTDNRGDKLLKLAQALQTAQPFIDKTLQEIQQATYRQGATDQTGNPTNEAIQQLKQQAYLQYAQQSIIQRGYLDTRYLELQSGMTQQEIQNLTNELKQAGFLDANDQPTELGQRALNLPAPQTNTQQLDQTAQQNQQQEQQNQQQELQQNLQAVFGEEETPSPDVTEELIADIFGDEAVLDRLAADYLPSLARVFTNVISKGLEQLGNIKNGKVIFNQQTKNFLDTELKSYSDTFKGMMLTSIKNNRFDITSPTTADQEEKQTTQNINEILQPKS